MLAPPKRAKLAPVLADASPAGDLSAIPILRRDQVAAPEASDSLFFKKGTATSVGFRPLGWSYGSELDEEETLSLDPEEGQPKRVRWVLSFDGRHEVEEDAPAPAPAAEAADAAPVAPVLEAEREAEVEVAPVPAAETAEPALAEPLAPPGTEAVVGEVPDETSAAWPQPAADELRPEDAASATEASDTPSTAPTLVFDAPPADPVADPAASDAGDLLEMRLAESMFDVVRFSGDEPTAAAPDFRSDSSSPEPAAGESAVEQGDEPSPATEALIPDRVAAEAPEAVEAEIEDETARIALERAASDADAVEAAPGGQPAATIADAGSASLAPAAAEILDAASDDDRNEPAPDPAASELEPRSEPPPAAPEMAAADWVGADEVETESAGSEAPPPKITAPAVGFLAYAAPAAASIPSPQDETPSGVYAAEAPPDDRLAEPDADHAAPLGSVETSDPFLAIAADDRLGVPGSDAAAREPEPEIAPTSAVPGEIPTDAAVSPVIAEWIVGAEAAFAGNETLPTAIDALDESAEPAVASTSSPLDETPAAAVGMALDDRLTEPAADAEAPPIALDRVEAEAASPPWPEEFAAGAATGFATAEPASIQSTPLEPPASGDESPIALDGTANEAMAAALAAEGGTDAGAIEPPSQGCETPPPIEAAQSEASGAEEAWASASSEENSASIAAAVIEPMPDPVATRDAPEAPGSGAYEALPSEESGPRPDSAGIDAETPSDLSPAAAGEVPTDVAPRWVAETVLAGAPAAEAADAGNDDLTPAIEVFATASFEPPPPAAAWAVAAAADPADQMASPSVEDATGRAAEVLPPAALAAEVDLPRAASPEPEQDAAASAEADTGGGEAEPCRKTKAPDARSEAERVAQEKGANELAGVIEAVLFNRTYTAQERQASPKRPGAPVPMPRPTAAPRRVVKATPAPVVIDAPAPAATLPGKPRQGVRRADRVLVLASLAVILPGSFFATSLWRDDTHPSQEMAATASHRPAADELTPVAGAPVKTPSGFEPLRAAPVPPKSRRIHPGAAEAERRQP